MKDETLLGPWVRRFLLEHLVAERNLARNTQVSYRDTLALLLPFASKHEGRAIDRMTVEDLTPSVVRKFLDHLEHDRQCDHPILGAVHWHALAGARGLVRRNTGDAIQEDGQDRDWLSRKGRDGRPPGATGSAHASRGPRPCSSSVLVQQRLSR
jgi:hypothetical protein